MVVRPMAKRAIIHDNPAISAIDSLCGSDLFLLVAGSTARQIGASPLYRRRGRVLIKLPPLPYGLTYSAFPFSNRLIHWFYLVPFLE